MIGILQVGYIAQLKSENRVDKLVRTIHYVCAKLPISEI